MLLHLIRSQDIDIFDIPISRITRQFHDSISGKLDRLDLDRAGEFLELAATLVRIKAQMLLPGAVDSAWQDDPRAELVRRLLEYELFGEVARWLGAAELERRRHLGKGFLPPEEIREAGPADLATTWEDFVAVLTAIPDPEPIAEHLAPVRAVTVEEKAEVIQRLLGQKPRVPFDQLFSSGRDRRHVVAALLACLELAKQHFLRLEQLKSFGAIWLLAVLAPARAADGSRAP